MRDYKYEENNNCQESKKRQIPNVKYQAKTANIVLYIRTKGKLFLYAELLLIQM